MLAASSGVAAAVKVGDSAQTTIFFYYCERWRHATVAKVVVAIWSKSSGRKRNDSDGILALAECDVAAR
jgi:hypothetical protein